MSVMDSKVSADGQAAAGALPRVDLSDYRLPACYVAALCHLNTPGRDRPVVFALRSRRDAVWLQARLCAQGYEAAVKQAAGDGTVMLCVAAPVTVDLDWQDIEKIRP